MALSNRERVGKALDLLAAGLKPFVERELRAVHADRWEEAAREGMNERGRQKISLADSQVLLSALWNQWNAVFNRILGQAQRSLVSELREVRNRWAHQEAFPGGDAYRALDSIERLLAAVSAEQAEEGGPKRKGPPRGQIEEQRKGEQRPAARRPREGPA